MRMSETPTQMGAGGVTSVTNDATRSTSESRKRIVTTLAMRVCVVGLPGSTGAAALQA
jgi:hypothetical protein